jgi:hypothetical protein
VTGDPVADRRRIWELALLLGIGVFAGWLRLHDLDLAEFKADEAAAVDLARRALDAQFLTVGLVSSIGAHNTSLFVYLTAIPLLVRDDPLAATAFVGGLGVCAVILTYFVLRPRFGAFVALGAAALFATAPWAVLYGRKLWAQSALPVVTVLLLWSMFVVLERTRTRAVAFVPVLLCLAFQLNFSAVALVLPVGLAVLFRMRDVHWRAFLVGVACAGLLLAPWLSHQVTNGFRDLSLLVAGGDAVSTSPDAFEAIGRTVRLVGMGDWEYVTADSLPSFVADAGPTWPLARGASAIAAGLFALGLFTSAIRIVRGASLVRRWPFVELDPDAALRAFLLVWLACIWLVYATPVTDQLFPHYLIVAYPVAFAVLALGLADLAAAARRGYHRAALAAAAIVVVFVAIGHAAFTVSFHRYLDRFGGTAGDYGVVYRHKADLARQVEARGLRVANEPVVDFLVTGRREGDLGAPPFVTVTDRLHNARPRCAGQLRSFGALDACFPRP